MVIDDITLDGILSKNILSLEYEVQQCFEHEILVEAAASQTKAQQETLNELLNNARAYLQVEGNTVSMTLNFLNIPKGMEEYAEMLKSNSASFIQPYLKTMIEDTLSLDDAQDQIREQVKEWAISNLQSVLGGIS